MAFGIYVHIPYCIQRCSYCDFATYEKSSILPPIDYISTLKKEIQVYGHLLNHKIVDTIYFGGGTPSLVEAPLLVSVIEALRDQGFVFADNIEITIEINPATITTEKLNIYLAAGINRFSVGAQTFNDDLLKKVGREHNAQDTVKTLELLADRKLNYTFDILFALPKQTKRDLEIDLEWVRRFKPPHISAYCLTVPDSHPLSKVRLPELDQIEMFDVIETGLKEAGLHRYEISNFSRPKFESRHNMIYWTDQEFWGVGLSSHSYLKEGSWGTRFWNENNIHQYIQRMETMPIEPAKTILVSRQTQQFEVLEEHQALTDFCHIFLRIKRGLSLDELGGKFGPSRRRQVQLALRSLEQKGLIVLAHGRWSLTSQGLLISNHVFEACTFLD